MQAKADYQLRLVQEYRSAQIEDARRANAVRSRQESSPRPSIRRAIGRQIVRIGERVAAEPLREPARAQ